MNGQKLRGDDQCRVPRATLCKDGTCSAEVRIRIALAMAAMARLNGIWQCNTISFASKFKLYASLFTSILHYGCETWNLLADSEHGSRPSKPSAWGNLSVSPIWSIRPTTGCGAGSTSLWVHRNLFWQLSRDGNLHGSGMSHARQPLHNHPSGHLGGRATPWLAEKMLDG